MSENTSLAMNRDRTSPDDRLERRGAKRHHKRDVSSGSGSSARSSRSRGSRERPKELETDPVILQRRQKQIDYGKNSVAYDTYIEKVPKASRPTFLPRTPDKYVKFSRRQWDGLVKAWKLQIHAWNARNDFSIGEWKNVPTGVDVTKDGESPEDIKVEPDDDVDELEEPEPKFNWCDEIEEEEEMLKRRKT